MILVTVSLPWPNKALSPNGRNRWAKIKAVTPARALAWAETRNNMPVILNRNLGQLSVKMEFYPPSKRKQDLDNMVSKCKSYQDGIFEAIGIDDSSIVELLAQRWNVVKGGLVIITISTKG